MTLLLLCVRRFDGIRCATAAYTNQWLTAGLLATNTLYSWEKRNIPHEFKELPCDLT